MQIRSLGGVSWSELAPVFNEAFSDYAVPMAMTADSLANMQRRRGYVADVSFGAWDGSRLVGFAATEPVCCARPPPAQRVRCASSISIAAQMTSRRFLRPQAPRRSGARSRWSARALADSIVLGSLIRF